MTIQDTFIDNTKPASKANQLSCEITHGEATRSITVKRILTSSHTNKPAKAAPACTRRICRAQARANTAEGSTTATTPQATDDTSRH